MDTRTDFGHMFVPMVTPLTNDGSVAVDEVESLVHRFADAGAAGIVALGTTGEPATLRDDERHVVRTVVARACAERSLHCCVGAGTNDTQRSQVEIARAADDGAQSVLVVSPYYTRPSEAGIVAHYRQLAATSPVPIVAYNIPYRTGRGMGANALCQLAQTEGIAAVKQAVGGIDADTQFVLREHYNNFVVLCGDDPFVFPMMMLGAGGAISASANVMPEEYVAMVSAARNGDIERARRIHEALLPVAVSLFAEPSPSIIKGVLKRLGVIASDQLRLPMTSATSGAIDAAYAMVEQARADVANATTSVTVA